MMVQNSISNVITVICWRLFPCKILIATLAMALPVIGNQRCSSETPQVPKYHLIENCYQSKLGIAARANFVSVISCQRLALEKKGLALNFSPPEAKANQEYNCEVLKCAESDGGNFLVNDSAFDYYSIYGKPIPDINSNCVPALGMFLFLPNRMNFTAGDTECRNRSSVLADVTSEQRTDAIAQLLAGAGLDMAFAGMMRRNTSVFVGNNGDTLDCTNYRAWAPGHPRENFTKFDCMLVTRSKTWLSTSCKKKFPVLCELIPGGPYRRGKIFFSRRRQTNDTVIQPDGSKNT